MSFIFSITRDATKKSRNNEGEPTQRVHSQFRLKEMLIIPGQPYDDEFLVHC